MEEIPPPFMRPHSIPTIMVALGIVFFATPASAAFGDVPLSHPYKEAIEYVQNQGIVQGYPDGTYRPDQTINRAEFTKIVVEAVLPPEDDADCGLTWDEGSDRPFVDVNKRDWFVRYVCRAYMEGIVRGYDDGIFKPANTINFVEAAKIIAIAFNLGLDPGEDQPWYQPFVIALEGSKAIPISILSFDQSITRGEMAEMIYRLQAGVTNKPSRTYETLSWMTDAWTTYENRELGLSFSHPAAWDKPEADGPQVGYQYVMRFGPVCEGCAEGTDTTLMDIDGMERAAADEEIKRVYQESNAQYPSMSVVSDTMKNGLRIVTVNEGGICGFRHAYVLGTTHSVRVSGFCLADDPLLSRLLDRLAGSVQFSFSALQWQTIRMGGYSVEVPQTWTVGPFPAPSNASLFDGSDREVARFHCPPREVGYEGTFIAESKTRLMTSNGVGAVVTLDRRDPVPGIGWEPDGSYSYHLHLGLRITENEQEAWETSCEMVSWLPEGETKGVPADDIWQHIFESASITR